MILSVEKAFRILEAFNTMHSRMTLSEVAQQAGLDLSATQRFCHTLNKLGYLDKNPVTRQFSLALRVLDLGFNYRHSSQLATSAMPILQHLSRETEETVNLTVLEGTDVVYISRIQSRHVLNTAVMTGTRLPAYCVSPGRAILSRMPEEDALAVVSSSNIVQHTQATIIDPQQIMECIAIGRQQGYVACFEELYLGDASIAAPIMGAGNKVVGAISIATTLARFNREEVISRYSSLIIAAARSIMVPG